MRPVLTALGSGGDGVVVRNGYTFEANPGGAKKASDAAARADANEITGALRVSAVRGAQVVYSTRFKTHTGPVVASRRCTAQRFQSDTATVANGSV